MRKAFKKFGQKLEKAANTVGSGVKEGIKNMSPEKIKERHRKHSEKKHRDRLSDTDSNKDKDKHKHRDRKKSKSSRKRDHSSSPPQSRASTPPPSHSNQEGSEEVVTPRTEQSSVQVQLASPAAEHTWQTAVPAEASPTPERLSTSVPPPPGEDAVFLSVSEDEEVPVPEFHEVHEVDEAPVMREETVEEVVPVDVISEPEAKAPAKPSAKAASVLSKTSSIDFATETPPTTAAKDPSIKFQIEDNDDKDDSEDVVLKEEPATEADPPTVRKSKSKAKAEEEKEKEEEDEEETKPKRRKKASQRDTSTQKKDGDARKRDTDKAAKRDRHTKHSSSKEKKEPATRDAVRSQPSSRASSAHESSAPPSSRASTPARRKAKKDVDDEVSLDGKEKKKKDTYGRPTMDKRSASSHDEDRHKSKTASEEKHRHRGKRPSPRHASTRGRRRSDSPHDGYAYEAVNYRDLLDQCRADAKYLNARARERRRSPSYPRMEVEYRPSRRELEEEEEERYEARERSRQRRRSPARRQYEDDRPFRHSPYRDRGSHSWRAERCEDWPRDEVLEHSYTPDQREYYQGRPRRTSSASIQQRRSTVDLNGSFRHRDGTTPRERARQYEEERTGRMGAVHSRRSSRHPSPRSYVAEDHLASSRHSSAHPSPRHPASVTRPRPEHLSVASLSRNPSPLRERPRYPYSPPVEYRMRLMRREEEEAERERSRSESSMVSEKDLLDEVEWKLDSLAQEIVVEDAILEDRMRSSPFERLYHMNNRRDRDERRKKLVQYNKLEKIRQKITTGSLDKEIQAREERRRQQEAMLTDPSGVYLRLYNNNSYASAAGARSVTPIKKAENDISLTTASQNGKSRGAANTVLDHSKKESASRNESPRPLTPQRSRSYIKNMSERLYKDAAEEREKHKEKAQLVHEERLKKEMEDFLVGRLMARLRSTRAQNAKWQTDAQLEAEARRQIQERLQKSDEGELKKELIDGKRLNSYDQKMMNKRLVLQGKADKATVAQRWQEEQMKNCTFKPEINKFSEKLAGSTVQKYGEMKHDGDDVSSVSLSDEDEDAHSEDHDGHAPHKAKGPDRCQILYAKAVKQQQSADRLAEEKRDEERHRILRSKLENDHHFRRRVELDPTLADRFMKSLAV